MNALTADYVIIGLSPMKTSSIWLCHQDEEQNINTVD